MKTNPLSKSIKTGLIAGAALLWSYMPAQADTIDKFSKGKYSAEANIGYQQHVPVMGADVAINLLGGGISYGRMMTEPRKMLFLPEGNLELLLQMQANTVTEGPGTCFKEIGIKGRYNIIPKNSDLTWFAELEATMAENDSYKDTTQDALGQRVVFGLGIGLGAMYHINDNLALGSRLKVKHYSWGSKVLGLSNFSDDAGVPNRNSGLNHLGVEMFLKYNF